MNWFAVVLLFESEVADGKDGKRLQEESVRLFKGNTKEEAEEKARLLGTQEEVSYRNTYGSEVCWRYVEITEVQDLCENDIFDGVEVFSRMSYADNNK
ncbi:MAG TPA: DUF4288 domain-containing protein [Oligoflexia bacterium]|nr:DUF4288 domain-containing protein [Oligoflexia bacterium]